MTALVSYSTGTVSVASGGTTVSGVGTIWSGTNVRPGDVLQIGNFQTVISDVTDTTHLVIPPWGGGVQSAVAYKIWQVSPQRFAGSTAMATVNQLVAAFETSGFFVFVDITDTVPDPSLGDDGQYAFQPTTGKTWAKVSGVWTFLGIYKAFQLLGAWSGATAYAAGDVVTLSGSSYVCVLAHTNHTPPNTTYWQLLASVGSTGAAAWTAPAAWITATAYVAGPPASVVTQGGETYVCLTSHTSGTFATDLAAAKWIKVSAKGVDAPTYGGTSTTSLAIGTGSKVFTTQAGLAYLTGARVRASSASGPTNWMEGVVTYSGTTLTMTSDKTSGSGTFADWNLNVVGQPGAGDLTAANNLSDLASASTSRTNLGSTTVGDAVFIASTAAAARTALGVSVGIPDVIIEDRKASGTHGGSATTGSPQTRDLNTLVRNNGTIVSLATNQFTLGAGTYFIAWSAPACRTDQHQTILRNVTDSSNAAIGTSEYAVSATDTPQTRSFGSSVITVAGSKAFSIQHAVLLSRTTTGFGVAGSFGVGEVYTRVEITKLV